MRAFSLKVNTVQILRKLYAELKLFCKGPQLNGRDLQANIQAIFLLIKPSVLVMMPLASSSRFG